jgi:hypothetical protein
MWYLHHLINGDIGPGGADGNRPAEAWLLNEKRRPKAPFE